MSQPAVIFLVPDLLARASERAPRALALVTDEARVDFGTLDRRSDAVAAALQTRGIARGDRVALMLENGADFAVAFFGVLKAGAVHVPVPVSARPATLAHIVSDSGARLLIAAPAAARIVAAAPPVATLWGGTGLADLADGGGRPVDVGVIDRDLAAIPYTSGTTGRPKGVMLTHANLVSTTRAIAAYLGHGPGEVVLGLLPLSFGYGLSQLLMAMLTGFTLALERSFSYPAETLNRMRRLGVTGLPGVPSVFSTLLGLEGFDARGLPALRTLTNAADALPPAHLARLAARFPNARIFAMYGATECSTRIAYLPPERVADKPDSVGRAIPNCETFLIDDSGAPAPVGAVAELLVRGANVMRGYWNRPGDTARSLDTGIVPGEPVYRTGDLFTADGEGFLRFVGRRDDVFKCRGEKVSPRVVEAVACERDEVAEALAIGVPHPADGRAVKLFIVPRAGRTIDEAALLRHCRARLESHLVPRFIEFRPDLPRTESGKIRRSALREPDVSAGTDGPQDKRE